MEIQTVSGVAMAGVICSILLSIGVPVALLIFARKKYQAKVSSFFIGAGTFLLFAMVLEQIMHLLVMQVGGLSADSNPWLYYVYAAAAAAVFEETGRIIAMKFWMKKRLDFSNALMYGIGHGGVEAVLIGGLAGISNLISMVMINSGAIQQSLTALPEELKKQTIEQLSTLWTTSAPLFFVSGIERVSAILLHIGLSLLIYRALRSKKRKTAVLAYGIHFVVDFAAVAGAAYLPVWVIEIGIFAMAAGTLFAAWRVNAADREEAGARAE